MSFLLRSLGLLIFALACGGGFFMGQIYATANSEKTFQVSQIENVIPFPEGEEALRAMAADMMKGRDYAAAKNLTDIEPAAGK